MGVAYPDRRAFVAAYGLTAAMEQEWEKALDLYFAGCPQFSSKHYGNLPDGVEIVSYKGSSYLRGWKPEYGDFRTHFADAEEIIDAVQSNLQTRRAAHFAQLELAKDSLDKASTVAGVKTAAAAAIAALEARLAALEGR